jgi:threonine/homoserine/homoserine lactone efflux protein
MGAYLLFAVAWFTAAVTPGADTMLLLSTTLARGWKAAVPYSFGITLAKICMVTISYFGLSAIIQANPSVFLVFKIFGAGFLLWRAWKMWFAGSPKAGRSADGFWPSLGMSFAIGASNPQAMMFYIAVIPQVAAETNVWVLNAMVAVGFTIVSAIWIGLATPIRRLIERGNNQVVVNRVVAVIFVALAALVLARQ